MADWQRRWVFKSQCVKYPKKVTSNKTQTRTSPVCERWEGLTEKDFILWYADKHYDTESTNDDQLKVISDVCDLLVNIQSEVLQASLLTDLKDKYRKASV